MSSSSASARLSEWMPKLVLAPSFVLAFFFIYGLMAWNGYLSLSAYTWLLHHTTSARVATYAYVNPVVAVLLGWTLAGEALTPRVLAAAGVIVAAVVLITLYGASPRPRARVEIGAAASAAQVGGD